MADEQRTSRVEELQEQVNRRVREAVDGLQRELRERLRRAGDEIVGELDKRFGDDPPSLPDSFLSSEELTPFAEEAAASARSSAWRESAAAVAGALAALDAAGSQSAILDTLVRESGRFAGRTAVFLAKEGGLELWGSHGWDLGLDGTRVDFADEGPWSAEELGRGTVELSSAYCGELCSRIDASLPSAAVLVPLVLRDRLAAVVYADHADGAEMSPEAVQSLTYVAALALETLPFRERESTPTLRRAAGDSAGMGVWSSAAAAAPAPAPAPAPAAEAGAQTAADFAIGPDEPTVELDESPLTADPAFDLDDEEASDEEEDAFDVDLDSDLDDDLGDVDLDADTADDSTDDTVGAGLAAEPAFDAGDDEPSAAAWSEGPESSGFEVPRYEDESADAPSADDGPTFDAQDETADLAPPSSPETVYAPVPPPPSAPGGWGAGTAGEVEVDEPESYEPEAEAAPAVAEPEVAEPETYEPEVAEPETREPEVGEPEVEEPRLAAPEAAGSAFSAPAAEPPTQAEPQTQAEPAPVAEPASTQVTPPEPAAGSSQVAPPSDLQGPGRAFGGAPRSEDESRHEEARRLARLLVSEIRLYNEDEVDEGRRNNDIYQRLKEDIDRSRQMYEERVDPAVRDSTDYFYDELVRNLGGGDESALGL